MVYKSKSRRGMSYSATIRSSQKLFSHPNWSKYQLINGFSNGIQIMEEKKSLIDIYFTMFTHMNSQNSWFYGILVRDFDCFDSSLCYYLAGGKNETNDLPSIMNLFRCINFFVSSEASDVIFS